MKQKLQKIFTVFMVLTILVSSHAFAYYEHICLITNQKTVSFEAKTCAGKFSVKQESKTPEFKKASCCELSFKVQKVDNAQQIHFTTPVFDYLEGSFQRPAFIFSVVDFAAEKSVVFVSSNSSPPKTKLFILHDQFLI
ncbi:HYC_CC_PP family protein [Lacihabitans soyangensis]|uniref:Uncharacterized protein n=1 Tax=Lacihabitans soyangensis TaxID=869394 RepID=A0AAE3KU08_9BACT|nr:hypothetical protein [Lacihabitans soyangensis]MCP9764603.1 hypothetical protein [Lacihabitans soyangensis]